MKVFSYKENKFALNGHHEMESLEPGENTRERSFEPIWRSLASPMPHRAVLVRKINIGAAGEKLLVDIKIVKYSFYGENFTNSARRYQYFVMSLCLNI